jgi:hypothetical protein
LDGRADAVPRRVTDDVSQVSNGKRPSYITIYCKTSKISGFSNEAQQSSISTWFSSSVLSKLPEGPIHDR